MTEKLYHPKEHFSLYTFTKYFSAATTTAITQSLLQSHPAYNQICFHYLLLGQFGSPPAPDPSTTHPKTH